MRFSLKSALVVVLGIGLATGFAPPSFASEAAAPSLQGTSEVAATSLQDAIDQHLSHLNPEPSGLPTVAPLAIGDHYKLRVTEVQNYVDMPKVLASCSGTGSKCTLSKSVTLTATVAGGFGASVSGVKAEMSVSVSASTTLTISCTSPKLKAGQVYIARPQGYFVFFAVDRYSIFGKKTGTEKGTAFFPTGIHCLFA